MVNETTVDIDVWKLSDVEWLILGGSSVVLAILALVDVEQLLRVNRMVRDAYMAATKRTRGEEIREQYTQALDPYHHCRLSFRRTLRICSYVRDDISIISGCGLFLLSPFRFVILV